MLRATTVATAQRAGSRALWRVMPVEELAAVQGRADEAMSWDAMRCDHGDTRLPRRQAAADEMGPDGENRYTRRQVRYPNGRRRRVTKRVPLPAHIPQGGGVFVEAI